MSHGRFLFSLFSPHHSQTLTICARRSIASLDYLVAPVLVENATERFVYLPKLPLPFLWQNYFTGETVNTTASSANISVPTPLDTFPLFRKHKAVCYPPALPPPPPPPPPSPPKVVTCGATCDMHPSTDHDGGGHISEATCASFPKCCALCKANTACGAFVWGPKVASREAGPTNPNTCFMLQPTNLTKHANGRAFGCVRSQIALKTSDEHATTSTSKASSTAGAPIIGVFTDPIAGNSTATGAGWVGVSMAKWLEAAGAQVVPVPFNMPRDELDLLFARINGLVFQGGDFDPFSPAGQCVTLNCCASTPFP